MSRNHCADRERGSITPYFLVVAIAALVMIGLAVDGGHKAQGAQRATAIADEAARAAGNAVDTASVRDGVGQLRVDPAAAVAAAQSYLAAAGVTGTVTVADGGRTVRVETTLQVQTVLLDLIGIDVMTVTGASSATLVPG